MTTLLLGLWRLARRMWATGLKTTMSFLKRAILINTWSYSSCKLWADKSSQVGCDSKYKKSFHSVPTATSLQRPQLNLFDRSVSERFLSKHIQIFDLSGHDLTEPLVTLSLSTDSLAYAESMTTSSMWIPRRSVVSNFNCFNTSIMVCLLVFHAPMPLSFIKNVWQRNKFSL